MNTYSFLQDSFEGKSEIAKKVVGEKPKGRGRVNTKAAKTMSFSHY